jgi:Tol biopolymer transport system component
LLLLGVALAFPAAAHATFPGANGRIAFYDAGTSGYTIETIKPDGTGRTQLGAGQDPAWSADGSRIAFTDLADIYAMNADGTGRTKIVESGSICRVCNGGSMTMTDAAWSPDSARVVMTGEGECDTGGCADPELLIGQADGSQPSAVLTPQQFALSPDWSPDGSRIAYVGSPPGSGCCQFGIFTIRPDGSDNRGPGLDEAGGAEGVSWSPDGSSLAIAAGGDIGTTKADGTGSQLLTNFGTAADAGAPAWSPDGSKIAFSLRQSSPPNDKDIYVMNANGTSQTNITNTPGTSESNPSWQPVFDGYARPLSATPATVKLVPASKSCTAPNSTHGAPLAVPACNPPAQTSSYLTVGTPDINGKPARSTGFVHMRVQSCPMCASPLPPDVFFTATLTDVRKKSDLSDYTGELQAVLNLRVTDRYNGPSLDLPATVTDSPLSFPMTCAATSEPTGGSCSANTSANAIMPGLVRDYQRAVWELGQVKVYDGGSDGDADTTADNTLFAVQGLFAP